jgi:hypothetical protein
MCLETSGQPKRKTVQFEKDSKEPWEAGVFTPEPKILTQPNIPKPLHGVNPRTILGEAWWQKQREQAKQRSQNHCAACGGGPNSKALKGKPWLECHEVYDFNYKKGRVTFKEVVALCHYCHNFIHSGRLAMIGGKEKSWDEIQKILEHGLAVLAEANKNRKAGSKPLRAFPKTIELAHLTNAKQHGVRAAILPESDVPWAQWRLVIGKNEHPPVFKNFAQWQNHWKTHKA